MYKVLLLPMILLTGCVTTAPTWLTKSAPVEPVHQVVSTWRNHVVTTEDPTHNGAPIIGITGRLFLFGADLASPVKAHGKVIVDLYNADIKDAAGKPVMLERWVLEQETLDRLYQKDFIAWGYTLFLPWATYRPDIKNIQLQVCYVTEKSPPMYSPRTSVTLRNEDNLPIIENQILPVQTRK